MYSAKGLQASPGRGCPIRTSPDQSLLAAPRGFSQPSTSFIGSWCQGIHRAPLLARRLDLSTSPSRQDQRSQKNLAFVSCAQTRLGSQRQLCICLLNYSSILQVHTERSLERRSWHFHQPNLRLVETPRLALQFVPFRSVLLRVPGGTKIARHPSSRCGMHGIVSSEPYAVGDSNV